MGYRSIESEPICDRLLAMVNVQNEAPESDLARKVRQLVAREISQTANPYQKP